MPGEPTQSTIEEMAHMLEIRKMSRHPTVLFLGSRAGGLFRSRAFYEAMQRFSKRDFPRLSPEEQFAECYQILTQLQLSESDLDSFLNGFLRDVDITEADVCVAELVKQGLFDIIITTNVDDLLELAFVQAKLKERQDFDVLILGRGPELDTGNAERRIACQLIKAFGDLTSRIYTVINRNSYLDKHAKLKIRLEEILARDVLVVGLDPIWDEEMIRMFPPRPAALWFVGTEPLADYHLTSRLAQGRQVRYIAGRDGEYETFFRTLLWYLTRGMPINYPLSPNAPIPSFRSEMHPSKKSVELPSPVPLSETFSPESAPSDSQVQILKTPLPRPITLPIQSQTTPGSLTEQHAHVEIAMHALSDTPSKVDLLGFTAYAQALTDFMLNEKTEKPLRVVIDAPWGMGKTTLMNLIRDELEKRTKFDQRRIPLIAQFNAWKYDQETSLWAAFVMKILQDVKKQLSWKQQLGLWWRLNWKRTDWGALFRGLVLTFLVIVGLILVGMVLNAWTSLQQTVPFLVAFQRLYAVLATGISGLTFLYLTVKAKYSSTTDPFTLKLPKYIREPQYREQLGFIAEFEDDFRRVMDSVTSHGKRSLIVFIDDLDRCSPPKPVEVVEAMNLLMDADYCIFVLGMDTRTVAASIEAKYKDLQQFLARTQIFDGLTFGERFLEKILQITFRIPHTNLERVSTFIEAKFRGLELQSESLDVQQIMLTPRAEDTVTPQQEPASPGENKTSKALSTGQKTFPNTAELIRRERFAKQLNESPVVQEAVRQAAPYLELNPRKIKRFINTFRLQALIANRCGLLASGAVRLDILAKWMALVTRWPGILDHMLADQTFIRSLKEAYALKTALQQNDNIASKETYEQRLAILLEDIRVKQLLATADLTILDTIPTEAKELAPYLYLAQPVVEKPKDGQSASDSTHPDQEEKDVLESESRN